MELIQKSINYLKSLTAETISHAGSGHTGSALGASPMMFSLFKDHLVFNPKDPKFLGRDRVVLSAGHTSAMFYSLLHMFGYDLSMDDLKKFRTYGSKTPGHPEYGVVPGAETTSGPLGQGIANAVGMAIAETFFASKFNTKDITLFDNYTYCYTGDGCIMEGVGMEACAIAGTLGLNKLVLLYDDNEITIDGARELSNKEDTALKFEAMGWNVLHIKNGHDYASCTKILNKVKNSKKPTLVIFETVIGVGTTKAGTPKVHAYPLPAEELKVFKESLNAPESFYVPEDVYALCNETVQKNQKIYDAWQAKLAAYKAKYPELYKQLMGLGKVKKLSYDKILSALNKQPEMAGRDITHFILNAVSSVYTELVGGSADVAASTKAFIADGGDYLANNTLGRNIHFGIREHAMGTICNGITLYLGTPTFDSTFLAFSNYMTPATKMRSLMHIPVLSIYTHDSIDVGQDGPTHQPIEQIGQLRRFVDYNVFRPATKAEAVASFKVFFESQTPTAIIASKSKLADIEASTIEGAEQGAYTIFETKTKPIIEIIATGREVSLAVEVAKQLENYGARVISMTCESLFDAQPKTYKNKVRLQSPALRVAIEASNDPIWYKYVGENGLILSVSQYMSSGSSSDCYTKAGYTAVNILKQIEKHLK